MKRVHTFGWLFCSVALLATGCANPPYAGNPDQVAPGAYPNIAVESKELQDAVVFGGVVVQPGTEQKPMRVTAHIRNIADRSVNIQYRYEFSDAQGRALKTNLGWAFMALPQRIEMTLDGGAMESEAASWRLIVRPAQ